MESSITVKGQITVPIQLRKRFGLIRGQKVTFAATAEGILVKPVRVEDLTKKPAWKKALEASLAEAEAGEVKVFASGEEFIDFLKKTSKK